MIFKNVHLKMATICLTKTACSVALTNYIYEYQLRAISSQWHYSLTACKNDIAVACK